MKDLFKRFMKFVEVGEGCWLWCGSMRGGYGAFRVDGKIERANRVAYELFKGEVGELHVCHTCDNPRCVNPDHLFLGTRSDNMKDAYDKGRLVPPEGQRFVGSLSRLEVRDIKRALRDKGIAEVAREFGVKYQTVKDIKRGKSYKRVLE
jgi:hypothetical protein